MSVIYMENGTHCLLASSKFAIWPMPASGDKFDPYKHPTDHLLDMVYHSDFDYYVQAAQSTLSITHVLVPADAGTVDASGLITSYNGIVETDRLLLTHGITGVIPRFMVEVDGQVIPHGMPNQTNTDTGSRVVIPYATATEIRLYERATPGRLSLPALAAKSYRTTAYRPPGNVPGADNMDFTTSSISAAFGRLDSGAPSLRAPDVGETPSKLPVGVTIGYANGQVKWVTPNGTVYITGPTSGPFAFNGFFFGSANLDVVLK